MARSSIRVSSRALPAARRFFARPARLSGFCRVALRGTPYPALLKGAQAWIAQRWRCDLLPKPGRRARM
jgi:hypothetical protein